MKTLLHLTTVAFVLAVFNLSTAEVQAQFTFTTLHDFASSNDGNYVVAALLLSRNTLYGTASGGGTGGNGTVFKVNIDGTAFATLHAFSGSDGAGPQSALVSSGNTIYGATAGGGQFGQGTVFALNTDGTGFTNLHSFTGATNDGAGPFGLILWGNTLYGTTQGGGSSGGGTVFGVNTNGSSFTTLHSFTGTNGDGTYPQAALILSGNTLYGTTRRGGSWSNGTVFAVNTDGAGFANLHSFILDKDGGYPTAGLVLSGNTLYGTAAYGGDSRNGTVFAVNTDGTVFRTLWSFSQLFDDPECALVNPDGAQPNGLVVSGDVLYGTTQIGGTSGNGTVFAVKTNGTGFWNPYTFTGFFLACFYPHTNSDGAAPHAGLILSGTTLYGTTTDGGASSNGTIFSVSVPFDLNPDFATTTNNGGITITKYRGPGGVEVIPATLNGLPVTSIGSNSFSGYTTLTAVTIPDSLITIGDNAFSGCTKLSSVTIPDSVTSIGTNAFHSCTSLTSITIPDSVTSRISDFEFYQCTSLTNVVIGNNVPEIGSEAFSLCEKLADVTIGNSVTQIATKAFAYCPNLTNVTIGDQVTDIGSYAFGSSGLTSVTIPNSVSSIESYAFYDCPLTNLVIPNSVTNIGDSAFESCQSLASVTIGNGVSSIGNQVFEWCTNLTSLTIPGSVTNIGNEAFGYCFSLIGIYFNGNAPNVPLTSWTVFDYDSNATVYYLPGTTGWATTFAGRPTAAWRPQVQTTDASFGVQTNQFGFNITWANGMTVVVEASTSLVNPIWSSVTTNVLSGGTFYFTDPQWRNYPSRFYRIRSL